MGDNEPGIVDERFDWIESRACASLKIKNDKFKKGLALDEFKRPIVDFLDNGDQRKLFIFDTPKEVCATTQPMNSLKKKTIYFLKVTSTNLPDVESITENVVVGELSQQPLTHLSIVAQEVFLPLLSNPNNQAGWPEVITKEVLESFHRFLGDVYVTIGQTQGKTLLPLPPTDISNSERASKDKDRVHVLESAVVLWSRQIKNVLKTDPEAPLKAGLNPGPLVEVEFWAAKAANLNSIYDQLQSDKIKKLTKVLELTKNTYLPSFHRLCKEVAQARAEANDNARHLKCLEKTLAQINQESDFTELTRLFKPLMHLILLVWKGSQYYTTPSRLVVLVREICNDIIAQARVFVRGEELFKIEPQDAVDRLKVTLQVCGSFKTCYFEYKTRAQNDCQNNPWRIQNSALFHRLDSFLERCHDILDLTQTIVQFNKLEKIEIGGTKGKSLTTSVRQVFSDFQNATKMFEDVSYDIMDVEAKNFDDDFYEFRCQIKELERRLGSVVIQGFDDCATIYGAFKLLDSFEGLSEREIIQTDLEKKYMDLLRSYATDLNEVQKMFVSQKEHYPVHNNLPPTAGCLYWIAGLRERIDEPMQKLKLLNKVILETDEAKEIMKSYNTAMKNFEDMEASQIEEWGKDVENTSQQKLKQTLLYRDQVTRLLSVNFDPALVRLLREVKYFLLLGLEVPDSAMVIYKKTETFRTQTGNLELIVNKYNEMLSTLLDVERPLVESQLTDIDIALEKGLKHLTWKSHGINDFISSSTKSVKDASRILSTIKGNIKEMKKFLANWADNILFERKDQKTYNSDDFMQRHAALTKSRYTEITEHGSKIHELLLNSNKVLRVSKGAPAWRAYVDYVNRIIIDGCAKVIVKSLRFLSNQIDPLYIQKTDLNPLLEIKLELVLPTVQFNPELGEAASNNGVRDIVNNWIADFYRIANLVKRLDTGDDGYMKEMEEHSLIRRYIHLINTFVSDNEEACQQFRESYLTYSYLWDQDMKETFDEFLNAAPAKRMGDEEEDFHTVQKGRPLSDFDAQVAKYRQIQEEIQHLPNVKNIGWLRVDAKPIKQALSTWVTKWAFMFTNYLSNRVISSLDELTDFMETVSGGLDKEVEQGDMETLMEMMGYIRNVRVRTEETDEMFEPLRQTVNLLKKYGITIPDMTIQTLEEAPLKWNNFKKKTLQVKEKLNPLQNQEAEKIKNLSLSFNDRIHDFRTTFLRTAPFKYEIGPDSAYKSMDEYHKLLLSIEKEASAFNEKQELFELNVSEFKEIKDCRHELEWLKSLWDMITLVLLKFNAWKSTLWAKIDVEYLLEETKKLQKEVQQLNKNMRGWDAYKGLWDAVKNMTTALPLVQDLRDEAMRDRHWKKLMRVTGIHFTMDDKFSLDNLLNLKLHNFVDDVAAITEQARQELKIEKQLRRIEETWAGLKLEFGNHKDTDVVTLKPVDDVVEALEDNQVALQNMMSSKYIEYFEESVTSWRQKLGTVDAVLTAWMDVQRSWASLESIFIGSEDIRKQLPDHSKIFDTIDRDFKDLMVNAGGTPNVIEAACQDGRLESLENMQERLEVCEKALADYLETKRRAFPRFYFMSPADLVDVLSKGSFPWQIMEHMSKMFDAIATLKFTEGSDGKPTKTAVSLLSKEKEVLQFHSPFTCEGPVETWLQNLLEHKRLTLRQVLADAINAYVQKPRTDWLFDFCAQIVVCASQYWWTSEVTQAFDKLEDGNETAIKDYSKGQIEQLGLLTNLVHKDLSKGDRIKVITLITIDVHARDVILKLIDEKVDTSSAFAWQSQLRYVWEDDKKLCKINIADAVFDYGYEYIGNCGRLVITPLTDRCYITLTQSLKLIMGGAPAGPAGTGKTETTKDLGRGMGVPVYVFNCSEQMDFKSIGNIYKGLAQTGAWGCFDEFNRISIEVLSVVATQVKSILDAIRGKKKTFNLLDADIELIPTIGLFITMNPGYKGRTELPENLKALFRPVAMIVPDLELICEIMLQSEGFLSAKLLARKFVQLYKLNRELLSKQDHYDWGLRAIKSVLTVAGGLKRLEPERNEEEVLMRALRDFNIPKIVTEDMDIFMGLIGDLFPGLDVPRKRDPDLEKFVTEAAIQMKLQAEPNFVLKVVQLEELLVVRHSVFVLGPAGCGKSQVWKCLSKAKTNRGEKTTTNILNPKAVETKELFGYMHPVTREPKDGVIAKVMRDLSKGSDSVPHKYIILDGDIDAGWIESMNTVMDDNKVLTLVSNERVPLTPSMRLIFEIDNLKNATPATVSRAGILFVNSNDIGWRPFVHSWLEARGDPSEASILERFFEQYVPPCMEACGKQFKHVIPFSNFNMVSTTCYLLEGLVTPENVPQGSEQDVYEHYFAFACMWAFGGGFVQDKTSDPRTAFSTWWKQEFTKSPVKFPDQGLIFDYYVDNAMKKMVPWADAVASYVHTGEPFATIVVQTVDTTRISFLVNLLADRKRPVMLVGGAGTGKTTIIKDKLKGLDDDMMSWVINFNSETGAKPLQSMMEQPLEKKAGMLFGPPGTKNLIYFIDDINMPTPDVYSTQSAIALLRQHFDYNMFYDLHKLVLKEIQNVQYLACMNPTAGSFTIDPRLQRHFSTFACAFPTPESLQTIYHSILAGHFQNFDPNVSKLSEKIVQATIELHRKVAETFLPTAIKFHYQFNLRELSNVFQGICHSKADFYSNPLVMTRLFLHECHRVYGDRLVNEQDINLFEEEVDRTTRQYFEDFESEQLMAKPLIFTNFAMAGAEEKTYFPISDFEKLKRILEDKLAEYNESYAAMDLVLFDQAMEHVCRISRIIDNPRGNALLVGVGGSGKQSLARLAAFISEYEVFQITVTQSYSMVDFKTDLINLYNRTGLKSQEIMFLLTDQQIVEDSFLVYVNDLLSSGYIPDLFAPEEKDGICNAVRNEVKQAGLLDSKENCWEFFIDKVRNNLHVVLCFSPVGDQFRIRCRRFPALTNCTSIDWFQPWPRDALVSVASRFLSDVDLHSDDIRENVAHHMAFVHTAVNDASIDFLHNERRYVYTTPKSFLELIDLYKKQLAQKRDDLAALTDRLETGLVKLRSSSAEVADMQVVLKEEQALVEEKKAATDQLLVQVGQEASVAEEQGKYAKEEEDKVSAIQTEVSAFQEESRKDLEAAEPALVRAQEALDSLDKKSLTELKSLASPPPEVALVTAAVMHLTAAKGSDHRRLDTSWNAAKKMMGAVDRFLNELVTFDKENIPTQNVDATQKYLDDPNFTGEFIKSKSKAAAGLCDWVRNIVIFNGIFLDVEPKRKRLAEAEEKLAEANARLDTVKSKVAEIEARQKKLTDQFEQATDEKNRLIEQAERTKKRLNLAERLVNGLADENERWGTNVENLKEQAVNLIGDVLLASAFIAYVGPFNRTFRNDLIHEKWVADILSREIPLSEGVDPLNILADDAKIASWANEGLPADRVSTENGSIVTSCSRWPLIIDPQVQGSKWIKQREEANGLKIVQTSQKKYLDTIEFAISNGTPVMIENLGEQIDAVLEPVLSRSFIKRGRSLLIMLGDREVEWDPNFRLYLQTKLARPHYRPEVAAQTTLVNFTITEDGLQDQLLAVVVNKEKPELEEQRLALVREQNEYKIELKKMEDDLLFKLSNASGDILADEELILSLEAIKVKSKEIQEKAAQAKETEKVINEAREFYRPVAARAALMYFLIDQLSVIDHMYQFSLDAFMFIFNKGLDKAEASTEDEQRLQNFVDAVTYTIFAYVTRGLFERHRLIFSTQLCFSILLKQGEVEAEMVDVLVRGPRKSDRGDNPCQPWLSDLSWGAIQDLADRFEVFGPLPSDVEGSSKRWKEWTDNETPEIEPLPQEWKKLPAFHKLILMRVLRPDRMTHALRIFVNECLGAKYVQAIAFDLAVSFEDSAAAVPIFFLLSPGVDPVKNVEELGKTKGISHDDGSLISVSLGQGQEPIAEAALEKAAKNGTWVMLQNIDLTAKWLITLEKLLENLKQEAHPDCRIFLSAQPSEKIPVGILQDSIKLTNEPPQGLDANLHRALGAFNDSIFEGVSKQAEFKSILFALCFFHAVILERRKFGPQGWNRSYPFNQGDLTVSISVLSNYLENSNKVPWDDLRYIFGEIMYGGHITDDWDRRLCNTYLKIHVKEELLDGQVEFFKGFNAPPNNLSHAGYVEYINENLPSETPVAYGLHPNAEIGFLTTQSNTLFELLLEMQPRSGGGGSGGSMQDKVKNLLDDILEKLPSNLDINDLGEIEMTPFVNVFLQESARMNTLLNEMRRSLGELDLGLKGDLTISDKMEELMVAMFSDKVPDMWEKHAFPSDRPLASWLQNLIDRVAQLSAWTQDLQTPKVAWLSGFFNPQSFLTAVMQVTARKNTWPLDRMTLQTEVLKKMNPEEIDSAAREGAYVSGFFLEGARWDAAAGALDESKLKDLNPPMPIVQIKAVPVDKADNSGFYMCPCYKTQERGPTFVFTANLKTKVPAERWTVGGVSLLLDVVE